MLALVFAIALLAAAAASQGKEPGSGPDAQAGVIEHAATVQDRHTDSLLGKPGVAGTAVGQTDQGKVAIKVYAVRGGVSGIPGRLEDVPVDVEVTGRIVALHHRADHGGGPPDPGGGGGGDTSSLSPTDRWPRPVPIGISTGNAGECSAGTIGARVSGPSGTYALSNNHVYALENEAPIGSDVLQPGRYDTGCATDPADVLGQLSDYEPLRFDGSDNTIDAAIAATSTASLGTSTPPGGYGTPSSSTVPASINLDVQKYGRTSALTRGTVTGVNATVNVGYGSGTARFTDQIFIQSRKPFIKAGDSGSLAVTQAGSQPVGLLFAGDATGKFAVANEIDRVLTRFGVGIDGS